MFIIIFKEIISSHDSGGWSTSLDRMEGGRMREEKVKVDTTQLLLLTHVCRRWRKIAIGFPSFWTLVDNRNPDQLDVFIQRSHGLPLSLFLSVHEDAKALKDILLQHGHRIQRLDIAILPFHFQVESLLLFKPDLLRCLTVTQAQYYFRDSQTELALVPCRVLFNMPECPLIALAISPVTTCLPSNRFAKLTHMFLSFDHSQYLIDLSTLYAFFLNTPLLEFLHISNLGYLPSYELKQASGPVSLNALRSCAFTEGNLGSYFAVLGFLSVPETAWIRLSQVTSFYMPPPIPALPAINNLHRLEIVANKTDLHFVAEGDSSGFWLHACVRVGSTHWNSWFLWLYELPIMFPLIQITSLDISIEDTVHFIPILLGNMPGLAHLGVRLGPWAYYDKDTGSYPDSDGSGGVAHALFTALAQTEPLVSPALRSLAIDIPPGFKDSSALAAETELHIPSSNDAQDGAYRFVPASLVRALATRAGAGAPIQHLAIQPFLGDWRHGGEDTEALNAELGRMVQVGRYGLKEYEVPHWSDWGRQMVPFRVRDCWRFEDAEKYWTLRDDDQPVYHLRWE